jgi:hypothetical protein
VKPEDLPDAFEVKLTDEDSVALLIKAIMEFPDSLTIKEVTSPSPAGAFFFPRCLNGNQLKMELEKR